MNTMKCVITLNILLSQICRVVYSHEDPKDLLTEYDGDTENEPMRKSLDDNGLQIDLSPPTATTDLSEPEIRIISAKEEEKPDPFIPLETSTVDIKLDDDDPSTTMTSFVPPPASGPPMSRRFRRIYNPDESVSVSDYPFMAALLMNGELWCGAAIISQDAILTAAHCLQLQYNNRLFREYVKMLTVRVGSSNATSGGQVYKVTDLFFHPNYKPGTLEFNFAVIKLHKNLTIGKNSKIGTIKYSSDKIVPTDTEIAFLGWGSVLGGGDIGRQTLLQRVNLPVYDLADCQAVYGREIVTRTNFCAGYITLAKNICNHDAGGPASLDGVLVGMLSFSSKRCDQPDQPAVFSKVGAVTDWLGRLWEKPARRLRLSTYENLPSGLM